VLEPLEAEKCCLFSGCCLDRNRYALVSGLVDVTMLEGTSTIANDG
jgi:hypothetical protein